MEFLSNPIWQIIANAAIGLLTIIVSIIIFRKQLNRKSITYEVISDTPILSLKEEIKGRVQVLFDSKPVGDVRFVILKIWNSGNISILPNEYIEPIRIDFGEKAEILDADVLETIPNNIKDKVKASLKLNTEYIILEPFLLNSKDSITLKVLFTRTHIAGETQVNARIVDINQIQNFDRIVYRHPLARTVIYCSYVIFLLSTIYFFFSKYEDNFFVKLFYLFLIVLFALIYVVIMLVILSIVYSIMHRFSPLRSIKIITNKLTELIKYMVYETI